MRVLYDRKTIAAEMPRLARDIVGELGTSFVLVPILNGGFIFAADLIRALVDAGADPEVDSLQLSSYGASKTSSGDVRFVKDLSAPCDGQTVLLVDDVLDSGRSLTAARTHLIEKGAGRVAACVAVEKSAETRAVGATAEFRLFSLAEDAFLVGYGMDDAGGRRGLADIAAME